MTDAIVDTNVIVVANRQNDDVVSDCIANCIKFLIDLQKNGVLLIDETDQIRTEYTQALNQGRPYQLGAQFLIHIYRNQYNEKYVRRIQIDKDDQGNYEDFPLDDGLDIFDPSDRKFAALSKKTGVPVTNAVDSDWSEHATALQKHGIYVHFLCGIDPATWLNT